MYRYKKDFNRYKVYNAQTPLIKETQDKLAHNSCNLAKF